MTSFLPDELKMQVKERLRDARFLAREMRPLAPRMNRNSSLPASHPAWDGPALTQKLSDLSDTALQKLESVAIGLLSSDPNAHFGDARAYPIHRYGRSGNTSGRSLFARDGYFAAKRILHAKGVSNPRVSEARFASAYSLAVMRWKLVPDEIDEATTRSLATISRDGAIVAGAIYEAQPVLAPLHLDGAARKQAIDTGTYIACAIGLATAVAEFHKDLLADDDPVYESVCAAVDVRYALLEQAIQSPGTDALAKTFCDFVPHLP